MTLVSLDRRVFLPVVGFLIVILCLVACEKELLPIKIQAASSVSAGESLALNFREVSKLDKGDGRMTYRVDWGDGQSRNYISPRSITHVYESAPANYTITIWRVDKEGLSTVGGTHQVKVIK